VEAMEAIGEAIVEGDVILPGNCQEEAKSCPERGDKMGR
jgi:hypothetical protein